MWCHLQYMIKYPYICTCFDNTERP